VSTRVPQGSVLVALLFMILIIYDENRCLCGRWGWGGGRIGIFTMKDDEKIGRVVNSEEGGLILHVDIEEFIKWANQC